MPVLITAIALLGLAVGSFLNVVIHRVPAAQSVIRPTSRCPSCANRILARHNVPVLSWLLLRGKCAQCQASISVRYPVVELTTAGLFVALAVHVAGLGRLPALPGYLFFAAIGVALTVIDLDVRRLPNAIVLPAYPVLAALLAIAAFAQGDPGALIRAAVGSLALLALYLALALAHPGGLGFGDVKLAGIVGGVLAFVSYQALLVGAFAAFVAGGVAGLVTIASGRGTRRSAIPFGPFMIAGALLALFAGTHIADLYVRLISPA
ncbi:MAG TPA: prepilin peptidase [Jatrophihabitantaceae bacterium]|jgi:leader peptidase (prepilin peptidase)/N-methyltransferase